MAGINRYQIAKELIENLKKRFTKCSIDTIKKEIMMNAGSDEKRCVVPYLALMRSTGLIKETSTGWLLNDENSES